MPIIGTYVYINFYVKILMFSIPQYPCRVSYRFRCLRHSEHYLISYLRERTFLAKQGMKCGFESSGDLS